LVGGSRGSIYSTRFGIHLFSSSNNTITQNTANLNINDGIFLKYSNDNLILNNTANSNKQYHGIELYSSKDNLISDNNASNNYYQGISLISTSGTAISNNTLKSNGNNGIYLNGSSYNTIKNNKAISSLNYHGIGVDSNCNHNIIIGNNASNNMLTGVYLFESRNNTIIGNIVNKNRGGIVLIWANKNELRNNTVCENSDEGLKIQDSEENIVTHNSLSKNLKGIILLRANKNELRNNTACENSNVGLHIEDSEENIVTYNSLSMNLRGIFLLKANKNELRNNSASENSDVGLQIQDSEENIVTHNSLSKNLAGIVLMLGANKNELRNNTACENSNVGLQIHDSEENIVTHNSLSKNSDGIVLTLGANKNELRNNTACENSDVGLQIHDSEENIVTHNSLSKNLDGIILIGANKNELRNNTASENSDDGLQIQDSEENVVTHNSLSKNLYGIFLTLGANKNELRNNNVVDSKNYQARVQDSSLNKFNYNYWSDYEAQYPDAQEKSNTGIGDIPYEIDEANKDDCPYLDYSGWLNVVITPEYWEFYTKKGDIQYFYKNFSIENRLNSPTEVEILLDQNLEFVTDRERASTKTFCIDPKSSKNITLRLNVTDLEGYILRTITFKTEDYMKTTLVHGLVQPKINAVKIEGVDYHRNVVKGQINPFNVMLRNHGDRDEFDVTLTMGSKKQSKRVFLSDNKSETKTVPFEIDTSDMPLGITRGQVVVLKSNQLSDPPLDYLNLTMFVASELEASTLIVTNHKRMRENWGDDTVSTSKLKAKLLELCFHPVVNGIILDVANDQNSSNLYEDWDIDKEPEKANEIMKAIKSLIDSKCEKYPNIKYLVIVGDDRIIPFYRVHDNTDKPFVSGSWTTTRDYDKLNAESTVGSALHHNMFLTDNYYATDKPIEWKTNEVIIPELLIPSMPIGRLVESPDEITAVIDAFFQSETVNPDKVFVTAYDFMCDSALNCSLTLEDKTEGATETVISGKEEVTDESFFNRIWEGLNTSNDVVLIFQHAEHDRFEIPNPREIEAYAYITSQNISTATGLSGSITCSMGCFSGLNVPSNASSEDFDLAQAFAQRGVLAYIAPTSYSIGLFRSIGAHERLICYFAQYLCERMDVGTALTRAKQEYWATNYDISYIDEQVLETTTLYGLPMTRINIPRLNRSYNQSKMEIMSREHTLDEKPDILVISPTHTPINIPLPLYNLTYYKSTSGELLSDPNRPLQPKEIRIFHPTSTRMLHGVVLTSAKYQVKPIIPLVDTYMQSHTKGVFRADEIIDWYPPQIFKLKSLCSPRVPTESRQYLIVITGQYKGSTVSTPFLEGRMERLYDELAFQLYYASPDAETTPPVINVSHRLNHNVSISANASDESGIQRVLVTFTDGEGEWRSKDMNKTGEQWTCTIPINVISEFFVQAVDNNGNVAVGNVFL
jgi:parallel beta-helix repeat protein